MTVISKAYDWLSDGNDITGELLAELIKDARARALVRIGLYERYKGSDEGVPIFNREFPIKNYSKINSKLANDYFSDIIHTKVGYFAGKPVSYKYVKQNADTGDIEETTDVNVLLNGFIKRNQIVDLDSETAKMAAITGLAARLCYIAKTPEGQKPEAAIINIPPWETVFISDEIGITDAPYAIRYYQVERNGKKFTRAEFYDEVQVSFWIREETSEAAVNGPFIPDPMEQPTPHFMDGCPLLAFPNNEEMIGDAEKVLSLIDGYDRTISDVNSEIEQFRLAYLIFRGVTLTTEQIDALRQTSALSIPDGDGGAEFVTKNLNDVAIENHLTRLDQNIMYFSQSARFTDESFGTASGVALKFKIFPLESKCIIAENKFKKALYRQFKVLSGFFAKQGIKYDPWQMEFDFIRNFPLNLLEEAQTLATLKGLVSDQTAYSQMSFIEDAGKEIALMKVQEDEYRQAEAELNAAMTEDSENGVQGQGQRQGERQEQRIGAEASS